MGVNRREGRIINDEDEESAGSLGKIQTFFVSINYSFEPFLGSFYTILRAVFQGNLAVYNWGRALGRGSESNDFRFVSHHVIYS